MLIVGREVGQSVIINDDIKVTVRQCGSNLKLTIVAPKNIRISPIKQDPIKPINLKKTERKIGETMLIGDNVKIAMLQTQSGLLRFAIDAPKEISIFREEIYKKQTKELIS
ncbi:carbon storage regulator [Neobacillus sp. OS1-32]|uniref:Carbon storage regulator n=1 Tax=Neobacillus paridis TaxID=2803862 RepID=A0ABS1TNP6_9BACI|nr:MULTISPECIES: carbon storage regulator [Neobacillus]MBL4952928.1 carbon storage regulator [Neobacillus paridis]WML31552.1 carbon storage regulator [Neobacillus sp. OS1-32]